MEELLKLIEANKELLELYNNDIIFRNSIILASNLKLGKEEALIFALVQGYKAKKNAYDNYIDYIKSCKGGIISYGPIKEDGF